MAEHDVNNQIKAKFEDMYSTVSGVAKDTPMSLFSVFQENCFNRNLAVALTEYKNTNLFEKTILDIGCANGKLLRQFLQWGARAEKLYGIDLSELALVKAKEISPYAINYQLKPGDDTGFPEHFFDIVTMSNVFDTFTDKALRARIAKEVERILTPEGIFIYADYNPDYLSWIKQYVKKMGYKFNYYVLDAWDVVPYEELRQYFSGWKMKIYPCCLPDLLFAQGLSAESWLDFSTLEGRLAAGEVLYFDGIPGDREDKRVRPARDVIVFSR